MNLRISDLAMVAKARAIARGSAIGAVTAAESIRAPANVVAVLKAFVGAATTEDIAPYGQIAASFIESLRSQSVFIRLLNDGMARVPLRTPARALTIVVTGSLVSEGYPVPVSRVAMASPGLQRGEAQALIVLTKEAVAATTPAALAFIESELRKGVTAAADSALFMIIANGVTPVVASGTDAESALADLRSLLDVVNVAGAGSLSWAAAPDVANAMSTMTGLAGSLVFPSMGPKGGEVLNLPAVVSDQIPAGQLFLIDAGGLAGDVETVRVSASESASIQLRDDPANAAAELVSMWQTNSIAIKANLVFGLDRHRDSAVAILTGINWGGTAS